MFNVEFYKQKRVNQIPKKVGSVMNSFAIQMVEF